VPLITRFDPWQSGLCTCPPKLTLNPYTGCSHSCTYCYATSYTPHFVKARPKKDLLKRLALEAKQLKGETISISNSSDPYPAFEAETGLTRECLQILSKSNCRIQIITKSDLVTRDADILSNTVCTVALTITTEDENVTRLLEPAAPSPSKRLKTIEALTSRGIPVIVRIDPIFPYINEDASNLITTLADMGVEHITSSTYKMKPDNWMRLSKAIPEAAEKMKPLYFNQGYRAGSSVLLPRDLRLCLMKRVRSLAAANKMKFGVCRENLDQLNTASCDGSWLLTGQRC
jgi:DNA repair photolyase